MSVCTIRKLGGWVLGSGLVLGAIGASAQNDSSLPDAQIESNVLKALATASDLSTQNIQSSTVYGTVTLTGNVQSDALRTEAENLAARAQGVKKVVDELTIGDTPAAQDDEQGSQAQNEQGSQAQNEQGSQAQNEQGSQAQGEQPDASQSNQPVLQSDGTYAPAPNGTGTQPPPGQAQEMQNGQDQGGEEGAPPPPNGYPQPSSNGYPQPPSNGYPQGAPDQGQPSGRQPMDQNYAQNAAPVPGGQQAGLEVTVPAGAMLRIRINRGIDSNHIRPGTPFDGTVLTDVPAGGAVAIPRGASVTGVVIHAKKAGAFKGEGELSLQINSLSLGGRVYPLTSEIWAQNGSDKTGSTVGHTVGLGAFGALLGGIAGGGAGAAIGAGVGAGAGLAGSAATPRGQIIIPPESVITFRIAAPLPVRTVSEQEMQRLSYSAGPPPPPRGPYYRPYGYYGPPQ